MNRISVTVASIKSDGLELEQGLTSASQNLTRIKNQCVTDGKIYCSTMHSGEGVKANVGFDQVSNTVLNDNL